MMKKIISGILVVIMIVAFAAPAFADTSSDLVLNGVVEAVDQTNPEDPDLDPVIISVTLPTTIAFAIETDKDTKAFVALTSGKGTAINEGNTSVRVSVANVNDMDSLLRANLAIRLGGVELQAGAQDKMLCDLTRGGTKVLEVSGSGTATIDPGNYTIITVLKVTAI